MHSENLPGRFRNGPEFPVALLDAAGQQAASGADVDLPAFIEGQAVLAEGLDRGEAVYGWKRFPRRRSSPERVAIHSVPSAVSSSDRIAVEGSPSTL